MRKYIFILFFLTITAYAEILSIGMSKTVLKNKVSENDFKLSFELFYKELLQTAEGYSINYYDNPKKMEKDFKNEIINFVIAEPLIFVRYFDPKYLAYGPTGYKDNKKDMNTLLILGHKKTSLKEELKNAKKIVYCDDLSSKLFLDVLLLEHRISPQILKTKDSHSSLLKLFFKKADIAIVDKSSFDIASELNPQLSKKLTILKSIPLATGVATFLSKKMSKKQVKEIMDAAFNMNNIEEGKQLLTIYQYSTIDVSKVEDLDSLYEMEERYKKLKKGKAN